MRNRIAPKVVVLTVTFSCLLSIASAFAQDPPELQTWKRNTTGATGYNGLPADVQLVRYSVGSVYVSCSGVPSYSIGPWPGNPNTPSNQSYVFKIPRSPVENTGTKTATSLGAIAVWRNGVPVYNALDAMSYLNQNIWHQNAVHVEASSFDACLGHPAPGGRYHHHQNPVCLYATDSTTHSGILAYSFDGFPIYGPYGFANADGSGGVKRMRSSYQTRSISVRTSLPDGTILSPAQYGPAVSGTYPLGYYVEDYEFVQGLGDLDAYNGRFTVTPEYPAGIYAYFVTINANGSSAYPYAIGPRYYGLIANENVATGGHVTVGESVTQYNPAIPVVEFTYLPATPSAGQAVQFSDASTNSPSAWVWSFGDGDSSAAQSPSHTYAGAGLYTVTLVAANGAGANTTAHDVTVVAGNVCGDADGAASITIGDAVYLIDYIFSGGPAPSPVSDGDASCDATVNIGDVVYLIEFIFSGGPSPCFGC